MAKRNRITVDSFSASNFHTTESRPYLFTDPATIWIHFTRTLATGRKYKGVISICLLDGYMTDGASTKWPVSLLVPNWRHGDDRYNATPDVLPSVRGLIPGSSETHPSSTFPGKSAKTSSAGCGGAADKAVEIFAGSDEHWGR